MAGRIILGIANPALDSNGQVDATATLTFYENGTTVLQSIYSDFALLTPLPNPLSCDAAGRFPIIWSPVGNLYSVKWTPTGAAPITYDDIEPSNDQETGTWTPTDASGAALVFTAVSAGFTRIGNMVFAYCNFTYPATSDPSTALIDGLPFPLPNQLYARQGVLSYANSSVNVVFTAAVAGDTKAAFYGIAGGLATNANMTGVRVQALYTYPIS